MDQWTQTIVVFRERFNLQRGCWSSEHREHVGSFVRQAGADDRDDLAAIQYELATTNDKDIP